MVDIVKDYIYNPTLHLRECEVEAEGRGRICGSIYARTGLLVLSPAERRHRHEVQGLERGCPPAKKTNIVPPRVLPANIFTS